MACSTPGEVLMGWSHQPCFPRTSKCGLRHFVHRRGVELPEGLEWNETEQHRLVKSLIVDAAIAAGWSAYPEVVSKDRTWIADVLTERDGRKVVFEVQYSRQDPTEYARRQQRYQDAGVECVWFRAHRFM